MNITEHNITKNFQLKVGSDDGTKSKRQEEKKKTTFTNVNVKTVIACLAGAPNIYFSEHKISYNSLLSFFQLFFLRARENWLHLMKHLINLFFVAAADFVNQNTNDQDRNSFVFFLLINNPLYSRQQQDQRANRSI